MNLIENFLETRQIFSLVSRCGNNFSFSFIHEIQNFLHFLNCNVQRESSKNKNCAHILSRSEILKNIKSRDEEKSEWKFFSRESRKWWWITDILHVHMWVQESAMMTNALWCKRSLSVRKCEVLRWNCGTYARLMQLVTFSFISLILKANKARHVWEIKIAKVINLWGIIWD